MRRCRILALLLGCLLAPRVAEGATRVILDTDGDGDYDDFAALMVAAVDPEVELVGVVVTGPKVEVRARSAAKVLRLMGRTDVGVHLGESVFDPPPSLSYMDQFPPRRHGLMPELRRWAEDFDAAVSEASGIEFYAEAILGSPGALTVVVTGPLSTLAAAVERADAEGRGAAFRSGLGRILFSGGDFETAEWNVYVDRAAARRVLASGIPLYEFGGEDEPKAYLTHPRRRELWESRTPATRALRELYRLYRAGYDPRAPFVPILYDVHPLAFISQGEAISRFEPLAVEIDAVGRLVRTAGPPNLMSRVENHGERLVEWAVHHLRARVAPAANHLRAARSALGTDAPPLARELERALAQLPASDADEPGAALAALERLEAELAARGAPAADARWHVAMARRFLAARESGDGWRDIYSERVVAVLIPLHVLWISLPKRRIALVLAVALAAGALWLAVRRGRDRGSAEADR